MNFDYLSWEAFATLLTGALAVGAAVYIGRRQTDIQTKQVLIQNRLADLEEFKLRQALFDARYEVYSASSKWLTATVMSGVPPYSTKDLEGPQRDLEMKWANNFLDAVDRSRFLYRPTVHDELMKMWQAGDQLARSNRTLEKESTPQKQRKIEAERQAEAFKYLSERQRNFSDLFGDELVLTAHRPAGGGA